jgi:hypothetical protein
MGSIDQNLRSCAGVEKERRCGIPLTASERWSNGQLWLIDGSPNELLSGVEIKHYWACNRVWETRRWDRRLWRRVDVISRRAGLILDLCRFSDARRFDADFLKDRRSAGEAPAQRFDKAIVALGAFGTGCGA